ncbi:MAG: PDZ domain-containing protein, partial [Chloroflexota bacterium]|nr:PDZ domain-containing protein [Chloroflexota bacterium]
MSHDALGYLDEVLDHLQAHSVRSTAVDWAALRRDVQAMAGDARSTAETYPAIELALQRLGDGHSFFLTPEQERLLREGQALTTGLTVVHPDGIVVKVLPHSPAAQEGVREGDLIERINGQQPAEMDHAGFRAAMRAPAVELQIRRPGADGPIDVTVHPAACPIVTEPVGRRLAPGVGYLELPDMSGTADQATAYAEATQRHIRALREHGAHGWIVDLRRNTGGNMWPMLAGVGPLVGEGVLGAFVFSDQVAQWSYRAGQAFLEEHILARVDDPCAPIQ